MDLRWEAKMGVLCEVEELGCDGAAEEGGQEERGGWTGEPPPPYAKRLPNGPFLHPVAG